MRMQFATGQLPILVSAVLHKFSTVVSFSQTSSIALKRMFANHGIVIR